MESSRVGGRDGAVMAANSYPEAVAEQVSQLQEKMAKLAEELLVQHSQQEKKKIEEEKDDTPRSPLNLTHRVVHRRSTYLSQQLLPIRKKAEEMVEWSSKTGFVLPRPRNLTLRLQREKKAGSQSCEKMVSKKKGWEFAMSDLGLYTALEESLKKLHRMQGSFLQQPLDERLQSDLESCIEQLIRYGMTDYEDLEEHICLSRIVARLPLKESCKEELINKIASMCKEKIQQRGGIRIAVSSSPRSMAESSDSVEQTSQSEDEMKGEHEKIDTDKNCPNALYDRLAIRLLYTLCPAGNLSDKQITELGAWPSASFLEDSALLGRRWAAFGLFQERERDDSRCLIDLLLIALDTEMLDFEQRKRLLLLALRWSKKQRERLHLQEGARLELKSVKEYLNKIVNHSAGFFQREFKDEISQCENQALFSRRSMLFSFSEQSSLSLFSFFPELLEQAENKQAGAVKGMGILALSMEKKEASSDWYKKLRRAVIASFVSIPRKELISVLAEKEEPGAEFTCFSQLWDRISGWVYLELMLEKNAKKTAYSFFLEAACKSYEENDFFTCSAIFLSLQQAKIEKLYADFIGMKEFSQKIEALSSVFSPMNNWKNLADIVSVCENNNTPYLPPPFLLLHHASPIRVQIDRGVPIVFRSIGRCFDREIPLKIIFQFEEAQKQIRSISPTSVDDFIYLRQLAALPTLRELQKGLI